MTSKPGAAQEWDGKYAHSPSLFGEEPNAFLLRHRDVFKPGQKALVVADGSGRHGAWLASVGLQVEAFDISAEADRQARRLDLRRGVTVRRQVCGWRDWPCWSGYDHVVAIFVQFAAPPERTEMFARFRDALAVGGHLHLLGYGEGQLALGTGGPKELAKLYSPEQLAEDFAELERVELVASRVELDEGTAHRGPSELLALLARRRAA